MNSVVAQGQRIVIIATNMLSRIDITAPGAMEQLREVRELLELGRALLGAGQPASALAM